MTGAEWRQTQLSALRSGETSTSGASGSSAPYQNGQYPVVGHADAPQMYASPDQQSRHAPTQPFTGSGYMTKSAGIPVAVHATAASEQVSVQLPPEGYPSRPQPAAAAAPEVSYSWLVPDGSRRYWAVWTMLITLVCCFLFAFMAGQYGQYQLISMGTGASSGQNGLQLDQWGPDSLWNWLTFWANNPAYTFNFEYLLAWGGRYSPSIAAGQWWRIFSSIILHGSFTHLLVNMVIFWVLATDLEHVYGPIRVALIFVISGLGGTFLSMAFEDPCAMYCGASGAVMGFLGLYIADCILNWESIAMPAVRLGTMLLAIVFMLIMEYLVMPKSAAGLAGISHLSHVGGLVCGLFVSWLFLPNFADRRWRRVQRFAARVNRAQRAQHGGRASSAAATVAGLPHVEKSFWRRHRWLYILVWFFCAAVMLMFFLALPLYLWLQKLPNLQCPAT